MELKLIKKRVVFRMSGVEVLLDLVEGVFSSYDVDVGTRVLLGSLRKNTQIFYEDILDLGCGSGVIGIFLKNKFPTGRVDMVDRSALAVALSRHNAILNNIEADFRCALDYEEAKGVYSLIVCNFPAKMERQGLELFLAGASHQLRPGGVFAFVVVRELFEEVKPLLLNEGIVVQHAEERSGHYLWHITFNHELSMPLEPYKRAEVELPLKGGISVSTVRGLAEFDSLSHASEACLELLTEISCAQSLMVLEPGQGHIALAAAMLLKPPSMELYSKDALALRASEAMLNASYQGQVKVSLAPYLTEAPSHSLIIWCVSGKREMPIHRLNWRVLREGDAEILLNGDRACVERLLEEGKMKVLDEAQRDNGVAYLLRRR